MPKLFTKYVNSTVCKLKVTMQIVCLEELMHMSCSHITSISVCITVSEH